MYLFNLFFILLFIYKKVKKKERIYTEVTFTFLPFGFGLFTDCQLRSDSI